MTDSDFGDIGIHDNLYRVLPEILTMLLSVKPFPQQKHLFKFRTGRKPEASLLFSTDRSCVGLKKGFFPALSPKTWFAGMFLSHLGGGKVPKGGFFSKSRLDDNVKRNEKAAYQIGMTPRKKWGEKESLLEHSAQEHRSCNVRNHHRD